MTVVGDDDQSIYRFRGAAISNILEFRERYRGARTVVLRRNYRSLAPILDGAHRLDPVQRPGPPRGAGRDLEAAARGAVRARTAPPVRHHAFATTGEEADWIAGEIRRRVERAPGRGTTRCSCGRTPTRTPVLRSLNGAGLPWRFSGTSGLYSRPEVRLLLALLRAVADPALERRRLRPRGVGAVRHPCRRSRRRRRLGAAPPPNAVRGPGGARGRSRASLRLSPGGPHRASPACTADLRRYRELAQRRPAGEVLYAFLRDSGWLAELAGGDERRRRGAARQHRAVLRHRADPVGAPRRRPRGLPRAPPRHAHRGGRRPGDRRPGSRRRRGPRHDGAQGEGPRVPGGVPAGPRRGSASRRDRGASRWRCRSSWSTRCCRRATATSRRSGACSTWR